MRNAKFRALLVLLLSVLFLPASSRAQLLADPIVVPERPLPFEPVNARLTVDDCAFDRDSVLVSGEQGTVSISMRPRACLQPGPTRVVDILIGAFAAGQYRLDVIVHPLVGLGPSRLWSLPFVVAQPPRIALVGPQKLPLTNYSGMWWNPPENGWGLSIHQGPTGALVATWFVYNANGQPEWFTIQPGNWTDYRTWTGTIYRTSGPRIFGADYDARVLSIVPVGTATIRFEQPLHAVGTATLEYVVDGIFGTRTIRPINN